MYLPAQSWNRTVTWPPKFPLLLRDQPLPAPPASDNHWSAFHPCSFAFSRMFYKWMHAICSFGDLASFIVKYSFYSTGHDSLLLLFILLLKFPSFGCWELFQVGSCDLWTCPHHFLSTSFLSGTINWSWLILYFPFLSPEIPAQFSKEHCIPGKSTPVGQTACPQRRGLGETLTRPLQGPRKRRDGGLLSPEGTEAAGQRGYVQTWVHCVTWAGGGQMPTLISCICGFYGFWRHLPTALCMKVCQGFLWF